MQAKWAGAWDMREEGAILARSFYPMPAGNPALT